MRAPRSRGLQVSEDYPVDPGYAGGLYVDASFPPGVDDGLAGMEMLFHGGSGFAFRSIMWMIPEVDLGFVALTNGHDPADESWLPQVSRGVRSVLFGLDAEELEVRSPFLRRFGNQLMLALVAVQLVLAVMTIRVLRRRRRRGRADNAVIVAASITDLAVLALIFWVIPTVGEAPLGLTLQLPDYRILILAMSVAVLWGTFRTMYC